MIFSGAMVVGAATVITATTVLKVTPEDMLLIVAGMCVISAWIAQKLHRVGA